MAAEPAELCRDFVDRCRAPLRASGIEIAVAIIDRNAAKQRRFWSHAVAVARRQARHAGCSTALAFARIVFYRALLSLGHGDAHLGPPRSLPADLPQVHVPTLNSPEAVDAVRSRRCDLVCLMGTRILTGRTLRALATPLVNIHSSDPRFVRGGPTVVWEVLADLPAITLTIHEVVEELDAGRILAQRPCPIVFGGGIGGTTARTLSFARPLVSELFSETLLALASGAAQPRGFAPGPLRVTPSLLDALRAELRCRLKGGHRQATVEGVGSTPSGRSGQAP